MASGFMNMLSYWFFAVSSVIMIFSLRGGWCCLRWLDRVPAIECVASGHAWFGHGHDAVVDFHDVVCGELLWAD